MRQGEQRVGGRGEQRGGGREGEAIEGKGWREEAICFLLSILFDILCHVL